MDYLYDYLIEHGRDSKLLQEEKQTALSKYWAFSHIEDKSKFLQDHFHNVIEHFNEMRNSSLNPIVVFATKYLHEHYTDCNFNISALAEKMHLSLSYLSTSYKQVTGRNLSSDLTELRMEKAKSLLQDITIPISEIAAQAGYDDARYFAKSFKRNLHMTPSEYRNLNYGIRNKE